VQIREALIQQAPSLALQRAAADEIARLDAEIRELMADIVQPTQDPRQRQLPLENNDAS
jgi:hypothetical protein